MSSPKTHAEAVALLREAIRRSGLSTAAYARTVLVRDPRSIRRLLAGTAPFPQAIIDFLTNEAP